MLETNDARPLLSAFRNQTGITSSTSPSPPATRDTPRGVLTSNLSATARAAPAAHAAAAPAAKSSAAAWRPGASGVACRSSTAAAAAADAPAARSGGAGRRSAKRPCAAACAARSSRTRAQQRATRRSRTRCGCGLVAPRRSAAMVSTRRTGRRRAERLLRGDGVNDGVVMPRRAATATAETQWTSALSFLRNGWLSRT